MGFLSKTIQYIAIKKAEEAIVGKIAEEMPSQIEEPKKKKAKLFKSRKDFGEFVSGYFILFQIIAAFVYLIAYTEQLSLWPSFGEYYAMLIIISCVLLFIGFVGYGLYQIDLLPILFLILALPLICILFSTENFSDVVDFFMGTWMSSATKVLICVVGVIIFVASMYYMCYGQFNGSGKKTKKQKLPLISDEEAVAIRNSLITAIQENAIKVRFLNRQWGFKLSEDILFGYDNQNKQLVFVADQTSHVLSCQNIVYLDYADINSIPNVTINTKKYQRLIKLYYLGSSQKEKVLCIAQAHVDNENLSKIKHHIESNPVANDEAVFRRKIRHLASTLESTDYPCRPFVNDEWFDVLKECMENIKNNKTDGYSLFREKVIANDSFMDDTTLFAIVSDMSLKHPNKKSAKKEARSLCKQDFRTTLTNNIKSTIKNTFINEK